MWGAHWVMHMEKMGVPGVFIVDEPFQADVQTTCDKEGLPHLRRVVVPHPCGDVSDEELPKIIYQLIGSLTEPLTKDEENPAPKKAAKTSRIVYKGSLEEVNGYFYEKEWTDGLPIFPPTEEKVREMLKGTRRSSGEVVTTNMLPEGCTVTAEKVATVGVMAGCEPEYMPVLLSIVEAFGNDIFSSIVRSTSSFSFAIVVNGPIAKEIGMNSGMNALGSGTRNKANAAIGRFLRLAIICLGGSRSGLNDMSSQGNPSKYSFAFAENEEKSPWEPFHVSMGYPRDENVLSILAGGWSHSGPFGNDDLDEIARSITTYQLPTGVLVIMDPMSARKISKGYSKQEAEEYIWSHATKTVEEFKSDFFYPVFIEPVLKGKSWNQMTGTWPARYLDLPDDEKVQAFPGGTVKIVVVGGETNPFAQVWQMSRPSTVTIDKWK